MRRILPAIAVLLLTSITACASDDTATASGGVEITFLAPAESWPFPFSPAVRVGDLYFLSGQIGTRMEDGRPVLVAGGMEAEARQTMDNVKSILESNGLTLERVVKCTVMLTDMSEWPAFNEIYASYFPGPKPARSALGANGLALGARVEVECIAAA
jgi:2-iminobutanoate/2-iminopropanoate deaminase